MIIRPETSDAAERAAVHAVNRVAFGRSDEADLVDALRKEDAVLLSLVAESDAEIVGHILFTRMWIESGAESIPAVALAPVAVVPEHQRRGIGASLIRHGLAQLRSLGETIVLVLGLPEYYTRFGFSTGTAGNLTHPFRPEAYMAMELAPGSLARLTGAVRYPAPFGITPSASTPAT